MNISWLKALGMLKPEKRNFTETFILKFNLR